MFGNVFTGFRDFLQIFRALFADVHFLGLFDFEVAYIFHGVTKLFQGSLQAGSAKSRRAHIDAAAALAEIHGDADDANFLWHGCETPFGDPRTVARATPDLTFRHLRRGALFVNHNYRSEEHTSELQSRFGTS